MIKNGAAILMPRITELPVFDGRVNIVPKDVQELFVRHFCRVIYDLNRLGVPGSPSRYLFIGGVLLLPAGVPGCDGNHARNLVERVLHTPEAAACEGRSLKIICSHDCSACDECN